MSAELQRCPKCGGMINAEHVKARRCPDGRPWLIRAWCEHCEILIRVRVRREGPDDVTLYNGTPAARAFERLVTRPAVAV